MIIRRPTWWDFLNNAPSRGLLFWPCLRIRTVRRSPCAKTARDSAASHTCAICQPSVAAASSSLDI
eukprot:703720-Amphidinium_carterae.1